MNGIRILYSYDHQNYIAAINAVTSTNKNICMKDDIVYGSGFDKWQGSREIKFESQHQQVLFIIIII